jgi:hypothetical protein
VVVSGSTRGDQGSETGKERSQNRCNVDKTAMGNQPRLSPTGDLTRVVPLEVRGGQSTCPVPQSHHWPMSSSLGLGESSQVETSGTMASQGRGDLSGNLYMCPGICANYCKARSHGEHMGCR